METTLMRRAFPFVCTVLVVLGMLGCGGSTGRPAGLTASGGPEAIAPPETMDINALPVPEGVDADVWAQLTAELGRVLAEYATDAKAISAPPSGAAGVVEISYYEPSSTLRWLYVNGGDYDQNGLVGVSDLTPLGVHFGEESPGGAGTPFPPESLGAAIDGNADGLIGVGDITPIGQYFGTKVAGYNVYTSADPEDYPLDPADPNGPGASLSGFVDLTGAIGGVSERKQLEYVLPEEAVPGVYWVRPTDGEGDGAASNALAFGTSNLAPIAVLSAEPTVGFVPLTVELRAFYSADIDGEIASYEWDFDGPVDGEQWLEPTSQGWIEHTYELAGDYLAAVRVTDNAEATDTAHVVIKVKEPIPPVAALSALPGAGPAPLHVVFDASGSTDADGPIANFAWDWMSDGTYDYDGGTEPTADFYAYEPGDVSATVRVTDLDGLTATAKYSVSVQTGARWHTITVAMGEEVNDPINLTSLLDVAGKPAIGYTAQIADEGYLFYIRANDDNATSWNEPVVLNDLSSAWGTLDVVDGRPAACWTTDNTENPGMRYMRANDALGLEWAAPVMLKEGQGFHVIDMNIIGGQPAIISHHGSSGQSSSFTYAADSVGGSWGDTYDIGTDVWYGDFQEIAGLPAFAYPRDDVLYFVRAIDPEGSAWPVPTVVDFVGDIGDHPSLVEADGVPAIAYYNATFQTLKYVRALNSAGSAWGAPLTLDINALGQQAMGLIDGRPAIVYGERDKGAFKFIVANDARGENWGLPMEADPNVGSSSNVMPHFCVIEDKPAFAYRYYSGEDQIKLAMYY